MAIPDYQALMLPLLNLISKRVQLTLSEAVQLISDGLKLTDAERCKPLPLPSCQFTLIRLKYAELLVSRQFTVIHSRVDWARTNPGFK